MKYPAKKRLFSTLVHMAVALVVLGCGKPDTEKPSGPHEFKVALLTPGPISDQAWNASAYQGLTRLKDSLGAKVSNIQTKTPAEIEENFRQYGSQGYDLVIGNGFEFQDPALRVAPDFPKTTYVNVSATKTAKNVAGIDFTFSDGAYLAGMVAGANTKSNIIGVIGGAQLPPVVKAFDAFKAGAKSVNPKIRVLSAYIGNWDDVSAAKEQALAQIAQGADMIFQNADAAGLGVFQAARESRDKRVRVFGANSDQNGVAPDVIIGSIVIDLPHAFLLVAREVQQKSFKPRVITLGAKDDVIKWVPNPALASEISPALQHKVDSVATQVKAGTFSPAR
jgi:basic membrane lipoprotein Med (substrate-binding protein (PBP1-ABC) superfamily)